MLTADPQQAVDSVLARFHRPNMPGMAVGVLHQGQVMLRQGYGLADIEQGCANATDVPMRIASLSKQFLVALALILEQEGVIDMTLPVHHYLPQLPDYGETVTLQHLVTNQSGIRDFLELRLLSGGNFANPASAAESEALIYGMPVLNFAPGKRFAYCNSGFLLLTRVLESVTGEALEALLQRYFFTPLNMKQTRLARRDVPWLEGRAVPYCVVGGKPEQGRWSIPLDGAGGLISTVDDLLLWASWVSDPASPYAAIFRRMATAHPYADGSESLYGMGFTVMPYRGQPSYGHHGQLPGVFAEIAWYPALNATLVLLANTDEINPFLLGRQLADVLFPEALASRPAEQTVSEGYYYCASQRRVLRIHNGMIDSTMTSAPLEWYRDNQFRPWWPMLHWQFSAGQDELEGLDGPDAVHFRRLQPLTKFDPARYTGHFYQPHLRSDWVIDWQQGQLMLTLSSCLGSSVFKLIPLSEDVLLGSPAVNPDGAYRPTLHIGGVPGARQLSITTDRTSGLVAHEISTQSCA